MTSNVQPFCPTQIDTRRSGGQHCFLSQDITALSENVATNEKRFFAYGTCQAVPNLLAVA